MNGLFTLPLCRRSYDRYKVSDSATLFIGDKLEKLSMLRDLSSRGAGIAVDYSLDVNERLEIVICSSLFGGPIRRKARVAWCNRISDNLYEAGLDFGLDNKIEFNP